MVKKDMLRRGLIAVHTVFTKKRDFPKPDDDCLCLIFRSMVGVLPQEMLRKRTRKNVFDLTGHTINFLLAIAFLILAATHRVWLNSDFLVLPRAIWLSSYGSFAIISFAFSPLLKNEFWLFCLDIALFAVRVMKVFDFMGLFHTAYMKMVVFRIKFFQ